MTPDPQPADLRAELAALGVEPGARATLLQFSTAFCAPCRATRAVLSRVADAIEGVVHAEVDAERHLELVRRLGVASTPTTLVLDGDVRERVRAAGPPRTAAVLAALPFAHVAPAGQAPHSGPVPRVQLRLSDLLTPPAGSPGATAGSTATPPGGPDVSPGPPAAAPGPSAAAPAPHDAAPASRAAAPAHHHQNKGVLHEPR